MADGIMLTAGMDFSNGEDWTMLTLIVDGKPDHVSCDTPWGRAVVDLLSERDALAKQRDELAVEVERLKADRLAADHSLVDRYRKPGSGIFSFPEDVAAIIRALDKAEAERDAALARAGAAAVEMRELAASVAHQHCHVIRSLPIAPDAQAALDKLIADARAEAFREALAILHEGWTEDRDAKEIEDAILARINEPQEGEK